MNTTPPDVVYIVGPNCGDASELRYSLRSLVNIPHSRVFIVGNLPAWAKNVTHIPTRQLSTRYLNAFRNLVAACESRQIGESFIFMNDDFFIMKKLESLPALHRGPISIHRLHHSGMYFKQIMNTKRALENEGFSKILSYELHVPMIFEKSKLLTALRLAQARGVPNKRTFYGNYWGVGGQQIDDVKISDGRSPTGQEVFLSTSDGSFRRYEVGRYIRARFPDPCEYEAFDITAVPIVMVEEPNYRGIKMKIQDYEGGEIHKTNSGNYVFVKDGKKSKEYANIASLVHEYELSHETDRPDEATAEQPDKADEGVADTDQIEQDDTSEIETPSDDEEHAEGGETEDVADEDAAGDDNSQPQDVDGDGQVNDDEAPVASGETDTTEGEATEEVADNDSGTEGQTQDASNAAGQDDGDEATAEQPKRGRRASRRSTKKDKEKTESTSGKEK